MKRLERHNLVHGQPRIDTTHPPTRIYPAPPRLSPSGHTRPASRFDHEGDARLRRPSSRRNLRRSSSPSRNRALPTSPYLDSDHALNNRNQPVLPSAPGRQSGSDGGSYNTSPGNRMLAYYTSDPISRPHAPSPDSSRERAHHY